MQKLTVFRNFANQYKPTTTHYQGLTTSIVLCLTFSRKKHRKNRNCFSIPISIVTVGAESACHRRREAVDKAGVDIRLDYSAEHRIDGFFLDQLEKGVVRPMPNNYLLVENSFIQEAWNLDQTLFDITLKGFKPILAHPERYSYYFDKPQRYEQLHSSGILFQINLLSLAGYYGKNEKKIAEMLIDKGLVDLLGSDMHNHRHCEAIEAYIGSKDFNRHARLLTGRLLNDSVF